MLETQAVVRDFRAGFVIIEPDTFAGCEACAPTGCAVKRLGGIFSPSRRSRFEIPANGVFKIGDRVVVGVDETGLLRASFRAYIVPLMFLFAGAGSAALLAPVHYADIMSALGAAAGLILAARAQRGRVSVANPIILRRAADALQTTIPLNDVRGSPR